VLTAHQKIECKELAMVTRHSLAGILVACSLVLSTSGCLALGGKTIYQESSDTPVRLSSLEARVGTLEQAVSRGAPMAQPAPPMAQPAPPMAQPGPAAPYIRQ
jgi:hypothetical protein